MLGILKITAGMATDGSAEFAMLVCDTSENVYEVAINEQIYIQLMDVIDASLENPSAEEEIQEAVPEQPIIPPVEVEKSKTPSTIPSIEALKSKLAGKLSPPQHSLEEQLPPDAPPMKEDPRRRLASVGFDLDYSASYDEEEEPDPGENSEDMLDEEFAEPL